MPAAALCLLALLADPPANGWEFRVTAYGAKGDATTDDTAAFQAAADAAGAVGGVVRLDPVAPGGGYVVSSTVRLPPGVSLIGAPSGMPFFLWEGVPRAQQRGAVILARPRADQYQGEKSRPLFELGGGNLVRGVYILYDEQPWPSDEEVQRAASPYHYATFEQFRERFVNDHARRYGPTFWGRHVAGVTIEDVTCHGYWDFCVFPAAGKVFLERIYLYGYGRGFALQEARDTVRIRGIHLVPNVSTAISWQHAWLQAAIAWRPENIAFDFGTVDGYSVSDVVVFVCHTGFRLGADAARPFGDPVTGGRYVPEWGQAPWGSLDNIKLDNVVVGFELLSGTILPNQLRNIMVHVSLPTATQIATAGGPVARQAAFVIEPGFAGATAQVSQLAISSFSPDRVAKGAQMVHQAGGRAFLAACPGIDERLHYADRRQAAIAVQGLVISNLTPPSLFAATADNRAVVEVRSFRLNGVGQPDVTWGSP
ncbi:MAG: hypothetical protein IT204_15845 [Fimbriimonadaceae bacterium]|nr:hypothetical protein [Fimbriimonadaceae bacterium]